MLKAIDLEDVGVVAGTNDSNVIQLNLHLRIFTLDFLFTLVVDDLDGVEDGAGSGGLIQVVKVLPLDLQLHILGVACEGGNSLQCTAMQCENKLSSVLPELSRADSYDGLLLSV